MLQLKLHVCVRPCLSFFSGLLPDGGVFPFCSLTPTEMFLVLGNSRFSVLPCEYHGFARAARKKTHHHCFHSDICSLPLFDVLRLVAVAIDRSGTVRQQTRAESRKARTKKAMVMLARTSATNKCLAALFEEFLEIDS